MFREGIDGKKGLLHLEKRGQSWCVVGGRGRLFGTHSTRQSAITQAMRKQSEFHGQGFSRFRFRDLGIVT